jgi:iron complex outermembrane recepter protein
VLTKFVLLAMSACWATTAAAQSAPAPVPAAENDASAEIADIVVTARKRAESAQSVPISLSVFAEQDLSNRSIQNLPDIQQQTPSLQMLQSTSSSIASFLSMRGQVVTTVTLATDPSVGVYVDGVYQPRAYGLETLGTLDISRIEVLKGPQGTLFGKNTTGGAINIVTNMPTDVWEGSVRARVDHRGTFSIGGVINVPLGETLAARFVAEAIWRDHLGTNTTTGNDLGRINQKRIRGTLQWRPTEKLSFVLRGDYMRFEGTGLPFKGLSNILSTSGAINQVVGETGVSRPEALTLLQANANFSLDNAQNIDPYELAEIYGFSATADLQIDDVTSLKSISAVRWVRDNRTYDYDGTPYDILNYPLSAMSERQISQELQLTGAAFDEKLNYIFGGYYAHEKGDDLLGQRTLGLSSPNGTVLQDATVTNKTAGAFLQATYRFTPELSATGGIRYTKDWRQLASRNRDNNRCIALGRLLNAGPCVYNVPEARFDGVSYTVGLEYKPHRGVLLYVKTSRGYRTGGLPFGAGRAGDPAASVASFAPFFPEKVTDYEAGIKADWLDGRLRTNISY